MQKFKSQRAHVGDGLGEGGPWRCRKAKGDLQAGETPPVFFSGRSELSRVGWIWRPLEDSPVNYLKIEWRLANLVSPETVRRPKTRAHPQKEAQACRVRQRCTRPPTCLPPIRSPLCQGKLLASSTRQFRSNPSEGLKDRNTSGVSSQPLVSRFRQKPKSHSLSWKSAATKIFVGLRSR